MISSSYQKGSFSKGGPVFCRRRNISASILLTALFFSLVLLPFARDALAQANEAARWGAEITTEELRQVLAAGKVPVLDVRSEKEYSIAHIPGSINIYEKETDAIMQRFPDKSAALVVYCNGPYCHKVKRVGEQLVKKGYINLRRYQLGLPVWRAFGNTVETGTLGFKYIFSGDRTAVFVDARATEQFKAGTVAGAVHVQAGEEETANTDGRLPYTDKGTRIVVFADSPEKARKVAEGIARRAFWNSSYYGGTYEELKREGIAR
jgi:rhodanese-related sulfurtransferase